MAASKHLGIRDAISALYAGLAPIEENRDVPLPKDQVAQIAVFRTHSLGESLVLGRTNWTTTIRTVIKARRDGTTSAESVADAIAVDCFARAQAAAALRAYDDTADVLDPGQFIWDQDEAESSVVTVMWDMHVTHATSSNSIS